MDRLVRAKVLASELEALGLTLDDLAAATADGTDTERRSAPTVSEYIERITPTYTPGTLRAFKPYWRLAITEFGDRPIDTVTVDDCEAVLVRADKRAEAAQHHRRALT